MDATDEMIARACRKHHGETWSFVEAEEMRDTLAAALADVPEPGAIVKACDMACRGLEERIAELEAQLAEGADTVMARAQTAAEEIGRQLSYAKRAEAAEAQLAKVRVWARGHSCATPRAVTDLLAILGDERAQRLKGGP